VENARSMSCVDGSNKTLDSHFVRQNDTCTISTNGAYLVKLSFSSEDVSFMCDILSICNGLVMDI